MLAIVPIGSSSRSQQVPIPMKNESRFVTKIRSVILAAPVALLVSLNGYFSVLLGNGAHHFL
jgi:hypothetical protein